MSLLNGSTEEFTSFLKDKLKDIQTVTHVCYFGEHPQIENILEQLPHILRCIQAGR